MRNVVPAFLRGLLIGLALFLVSLPLLFALHGAFELGKPPVSGLLILGAAVVLSLALGNAVGAAMGEAKSKPILAALAGLGVGGLACVVAAPLYGSMVVEGLAREAAGLALGQDGDIEEAAKNAAKKGAGQMFDAAREGRLREEISRLQQQARDATTPQARQSAAQKAKEKAQQLASQLVPESKTRGIKLLKSGLARSSAFGLLFWAIIAPPLGAAWECRRARR